VGSNHARRFGTRVAGETILRAYEAALRRDGSQWGP
jgi:hypothetical protein